MNPTENAIKPGLGRLKRIQTLSRILKGCVLVYLVAPLALVAGNFKSIHRADGFVSVFNHPYANPSDVPGLMTLFCGIGAGVYLLGVISFYRLLGLYEKGVIFSAGNVKEMKRLGALLTCYGIVGFAADIVYAGGFVFPWSFLSAAASPWVIVGVAICLVAWIMDEGRKLREEQDLTV